MKRIGKLIAVPLMLMISVLAIPGLRMAIFFPVLDQILEKNSVKNQLNFTLTMPLQGTEMLPVLFTFNESERASEALGIPISFTVEYTFSKPSFFLGRSRIMNPKDSFYGAFLGTYWIAGAKAPLTSDEMIKIVSFDVKELMLPSFGLFTKNVVFQIISSEQCRIPVVLHSTIFTKYESTFRMSTPLHRRAPQLSYLLYGFPPKTQENYPVNLMYGILLHHYFPKENLNLMLYALA